MINSFSYRFLAFNRQFIFILNLIYSNLYKSVTDITNWNIRITILKYISVQLRQWVFRILLQTNLHTTYFHQAHNALNSKIIKAIISRANNFMFHYYIIKNNFFKISWNQFPIFRLLRLWHNFIFRIFQFSKVFYTTYMSFLIFFSYIVRQKNTRRMSLITISKINAICRLVCLKQLESVHLNSTSRFYDV